MASNRVDSLAFSADTASTSLKKSNFESQPIGPVSSQSIARSGTIAVVAQMLVCEEMLVLAD